MRQTLCLLLTAAWLAGCAAPDRHDQQVRQRSECRVQQSLPVPGHNLLTGSNAACVQPAPVASRSEPVPQSRPSMVRDGPARSVSLSTLQAAGQVFRRDAQPAALAQEGGHGSGGTGERPAVLPALFVPVDSRPHSGFAIGGRLISSPEPGAADDVDGAELQFRFMH